MLYESSSSPTKGEVHESNSLFKYIYKSTKRYVARSRDKDEDPGSDHGTNRGVQLVVNCNAYNIVNWLKDLSP